MATEKDINVPNKTDCIYREAAKEHQDKTWNEIHSVLKSKATKLAEAVYRDLRNSLDDVPAADVRSVVKGEWEKHEDFDPYGGGRFVEWVCSECDKRLHGDWVTRNSHIEETPTENYCPNCGADMRGEEKPSD